MEKYGQYRDKGSGIAPFFPIPHQSGNPLVLPWRIFLLCMRIPLVTFAWFIWLAIVQWAPPGGALRKANLWCILGIPGVWWIDLQVDGVRRGSLSQARSRLPDKGNIIASSWTSPLDVLYLAAIFDPIFTLCQPNGRLVRPVPFEAAIAATFDVSAPPPFNIDRGTTTLANLSRQNPSRVIVVFPEATTSNGRGILELSPSLLSASSNARIYPISLRYTPADIVTPVPGWTEAIRFIWRLNSTQSHCIRVRIGVPLTPKSQILPPPTDTTPMSNSEKLRSRNGFSSNYFDTLEASDAEKSSTDEDGVSENERKLLDAVAEALARLARIKRVGLGVNQKQKFVEAWEKGREARKT